MTAWGWADSGRARSTAGLESAPRLHPMPASGVGAVAAGGALGRAPVRPASVAAVEAEEHCGGGVLPEKSPGREVIGARSARQFGIGVQVSVETGVGGVGERADHEIG